LSSRSNASPLRPLALESRAERGAVPHDAPRPAPRLARWGAALLRVPLAAKLAGANALIVLAASAAAFAVHGTGADDLRVLLVMGAAIAGSLAVNVALVYAALRPLQELEATAERVWRGDFAARVQPSLLADRDMARVGRTLNLLLDGLTSDRARMRRLAAEAIGAGDRERAYIARELHDSTAQGLAALLLQLGAAARDAGDPALAARLHEIKTIANDVLEEVRMLAHTIHPRVLDDLGLVAALRNLARQAAERDDARVEVVSDAAADGVPPAAASVLYRVAQEAVNNAIRHGRPAVVTLRVGVDDGTATLEVVDDGAGFDVEEAERRRPGMGLFTMRERVALVDGRFEIASRPGAGTRVTATVPRDSQPAGIGGRPERAATGAGARP
jgi:signal transduction histidine kinase